MRRFTWCLPALLLLSIPRVVGPDPESGEEIVSLNGRYGPYIQKGKDYRTIGSEEQLLTITLPQALEILVALQSARNLMRSHHASGHDVIDDVRARSTLGFLLGDLRPDLGERRGQGVVDAALGLLDRVGR